MIYHDHGWYSHQEVTQLGVVAHGNHKLCKECAWSQKGKRLNKW